MQGRPDLHRVCRHLAAQRRRDRRRIDAYGQLRGVNGGLQERGAQRGRLLLVHRPGKTDVYNFYSSPPKKVYTIGNVV